MSNTNDEYKKISQLDSTVITAERKIVTDPANTFTVGELTDYMQDTLEFATSIPSATMITVGHYGTGADYELNSTNSDFHIKFKQAILLASATGYAIRNRSADSGRVIVSLLAGNFYQKGTINSRTDINGTALTYPPGNYTIIGAGKGKTNIIRDFTGSSSLLEAGGNSSSNICNNITVQGITYDQNNMGSGWGIIIGWTVDVQVFDCEFKNINPGSTKSQMFIGKFQGGSDDFESNNLVVGDCVFDMTIPDVNIASVDTSTDIITTDTAYDYFETGQRIRFYGSPPSPLVEATTYYCIRISSNQIKVASTASNANLGIAMNLTTTGTGTLINYEGLSWEFSSAINARNISMSTITFRGGTATPRPAMLLYNSEQVRMRDIHVDHQILHIGGRGAIMIDTVTLDQGRVYLDQAQTVILNNLAHVTWGDTSGFSNDILIRGGYKTAGDGETPWYIPMTHVSSINTSTNVITIDEEMTNYSDGSAYQTGDLVTFRSMTYSETGGFKYALPQNIEGFHPTHYHTNFASFPAIGNVNDYYVANDTWYAYQWSSASQSYNLAIMGSQDYYVIRLTATTFKLASSYANAIAGTAITLPMNIKGLTRVGLNAPFSCENVIINNALFKMAKENAIYAKTTTDNGHEVADVKNLTLNNVKVDGSIGVGLVNFAEVLILNNVDMQKCNTLNNGTTAIGLMVGGRDITIDNISFDGVNTDYDIVVAYADYTSVFGEEQTVRIKNANFASTNNVAYFSSPNVYDKTPPVGSTLVLDYDEYKPPVDVATVTALPTCSLNTNIGTVLTATANGVFSSTIDGINTFKGMRILVKNESSKPKHGIWVLTDVGSASTPWVMTRAKDAFYASQHKPRFKVDVKKGTTNANTTFALFNSTYPIIYVSDIEFERVDNGTYPAQIKTSSYTITRNEMLDNYVFIMNSAGTMTLTLPTASNLSGKSVTIKCIGSGTQKVATTSSQTSDGVNLDASTGTPETLTRWSTKTYLSDGTNWITI